MYKKIIISALIVIAAGFYWLFIDAQEAGSMRQALKNGAQITLVDDIPTARFTLSGRVKLSDGDSLKFRNDDKRARLYAIDSPELAQKCQKNQKNWQCGLSAKQALQQQISGNDITCIGDEYDKYDRLIATCYLKVGNKGYLNLNAWQVKNGWATAYVYYSKRYVKQQSYAKQQKLGIWQGTFLEPFKWRQQYTR